MDRELFDGRQEKHVEASPAELQFSFQATDAALLIGRARPDIEKLQKDVLGNAEMLKQDWHNDFKGGVPGMDFKEVPNVYCYTLNKDKIYSLVPNPTYVNPFQRRQRLLQFVGRMRAYKQQKLKYDMQEHSRKMSFQRLKREKILELRKLRGIVSRFPTAKLS